MEFPGLPVHLFGHSMGSLIVRCYLKKYDWELSSLTVDVYKRQTYFRLLFLSLEAMYLNAVISPEESFIRDSPVTILPFKS